MADHEPESVTKAPESDVSQPPVADASSDQPAGSAAVGEHCTTDRPTPSGATPLGEISKIADTEVYVTKPTDYPHSLSKLLFLFSSGTGIHSRNNQLQADQYAAEGFVVVMPDQFGGDHAPNAPNPNAAAQEKATVIEQVKNRAAETVQAFMLDMWLARQTPEKVMPILQRVISGAREEFADAVAYGGGIYAAGYCFGAKYVLLLGAGSELPPKLVGEQASEPEATPAPVIKAGALAHGTMITREDLQGVEVPVSLICVENDQLFPDEVREAGKSSMETKGLEHEIRVYEGMPHGFAVVGEYGDKQIAEAQKSAFEQMLSWLKSH